MILNLLCIPLALTICILLINWGNPDDDDKGGYA